MGTLPFTRLATAVAACVALLAPAAALTAHAQFRTGPDRGWQGGGENREGYENGFQEGLRQGEADALRGRAFDVYGDPAYRAGDRGYSFRFGDRTTYRNLYRNGFEAGYRNGYSAGGGNRVGQSDARQGRVFPGRGGRQQFQEPAVARGFNDGYERGLSDGRDGDRYDPVGSRDYRDGDNGYSGSYRGTRDAYKNNYRTGFRQGYEDGYRDGTRYDRR
jgi:flagellar biosynthesis/type III secretory pathway protein FliH